ncbi:MAG: TonB-dependent receptor, partial [Thermoanaerobaculia bacterium]|nr:TonB-dependent receptor [Thermoanaerobaculia bacterium]
SLAAQHEREEGAVALDPARPDRFEQTALMGSGSWQPVADRRLDMRLRAVDDAVDDWPEGSGGPDAGTGELRRTRRDEWVVTLAGELVGTRVRHRGSLSRLVYDAEIASPAIPPQVPPGLAATRFERSRLFYTAAGGGGGAAWAAGAELGRERGRNDSVLLLPPGLGGAIPGDYDLERDAAALLLGGNFATRPGDDSLTLDLGLRLDAPEGHGEEWSPRLGIGWRPGDGPWRLRASAGRAFKLPSFFALGSPPALGGNPELSPETSTAIDVGTLVEAADGRVRAGLTLFRSDYDDLIDFDFASFRLVNRSRVRAEGVEIELAAALAAAPSGAWTLRAQATWQSVEDRDTGGELLRRPDRLAAAVVTWRPAWGGDDPLRLTLDLRYRGRMLDEQVPTGRREVGGHTLVALAAEWRLHTRLAVVGRLENVFDEAYETQTGYPGPGRTGRLELRIPLLRPRR